MQDIENKIKEEFEQNTPDLKQSILSRCKNTPQIEPQKKETPAFLKRILVALVCLVVFVGGGILGYFIPAPINQAKAETMVYLDVNPSIKIALDENNYVIECVPTNDDAIKVIDGMNLKNVELKTAINAIVGSMYIKGYLKSEDNSMLISVDTADEKNTNAFLEYITDKVNEVFSSSQMECAILAQAVSDTEELKRRAEEYGISIGKMHLIDKISQSSEDVFDFDSAQLSQMSIKDLNLMYSDKQHSRPPTDDEHFSGSVGGVITKEQAVQSVLLSEFVDLQVEWVKAFTVPSVQHDRKVVFAVDVKVVGEDKVYKFEVDCESGQISKIERPESEGGQPGNQPEHPEDDQYTDNNRPGGTNGEGGFPPPEND